MATDFLDKIDVSDEERAKLRALGASTPAGVLGARIGSPVWFDRLFSSTERAAEIVRQLEALLTDQERSSLHSPVPPLPPVRARIGSLPQDVPPPAYDVEQRDRLFAELHGLRKIDPASDEVRRRIAVLEQLLNSLLSGGSPDAG